MINIGEIAQQLGVPSTIVLLIGWSIFLKQQNDPSEKRNDKMYDDVISVFENRVNQLEETLDYVKSAYEKQAVKQYKLYVLKIKELERSNKILKNRIKKLTYILIEEKRENKEKVDALIQYIKSKKVE